MNEIKAESTKLYCVVENQLFYYALLSGDKLIKSEQIQINKDFNFFESADIIKQFLERSINRTKIDACYFSIASTEYALVPKQIEQNDIKFWLKGNHDDSKDIVVNSFNDMQIAFFVPKQLLVELSSLFDHIHVHHILETNLQKGLPMNGVISYRIDGFQLVGLQEDGSLKYQNLFNSTKDLSELYFSLLPYYILRQDLQKTPLFTVKPTEVFYDKVSTYVKNVEFLPVSYTHLTLPTILRV